MRPHGRQGAGADAGSRAEADRGAPRRRRLPARRPSCWRAPTPTRPTLLTSDHDDNDKPFVTGERTAEGFYNVRAGIDQAIGRGLAYAPYADLLWCETATPDLDEAQRFAEAIRKQYPDQLLSYNCSPSFNWKKNLDDATIAKFQRELGAMGYKFQFITLAGIHSMWYNMFELAYGYAREGMKAYVEKVQEPEFAAREPRLHLRRHQQEVGTGYFDDMTT